MRLPEMVDMRFQARQRVPTGVGRMPEFPFGTGLSKVLQVLHFA